MINNGDIKEKKGYVSDGIVDFDKWKEAKRKILFVLKNPSR